VIATNYSNARDNLKKYCDIAVLNFEPVIVTRKNDENVVILSEAAYNNLLENLYIRSSKANYENLLASIADAKAGKVTEHELIEVDDGEETLD